VKGTGAISEGNRKEDRYIGWNECTTVVFGMGGYRIKEFVIDIFCLNENRWGSRYDVACSILAIYSAICLHHILRDHCIIIIYHIRLTYDKIR
jgi:hypothetical protein